MIKNKVTKMQVLKRLKHQTTVNKELRQVEGNRRNKNF